MTVTCHRQSDPAAHERRGDLRRHGESPASTGLDYSIASFTATEGVSAAVQRGDIARRRQERGDALPESVPVTLVGVGERRRGIPSDDAGLGTGWEQPPAWVPAIHTTPRRHDPMDRHRPGPSSRKQHGNSDDNHWSETKRKGGRREEQQPRGLETPG